VSVTVRAVGSCALSASAMEALPATLTESMAERWSWEVPPGAHRGDGEAARLTSRHDSVSFVQGLAVFGSPWRWRGFVSAAHVRHAVRSRARSVARALGVRELTWLSEERLDWDDLRDQEALRASLRGSMGEPFDIAVIDERHRDQAERGQVEAWAMESLDAEGPRGHVLLAGVPPWWRWAEDDELIDDLGRELPGWRFTVAKDDRTAARSALSSGVTHVVVAPVLPLATSRVRAPTRRRGIFEAWADASRDVIQEHLQPWLDLGIPVVPCTAPEGWLGADDLQLSLYNDAIVRLAGAQRCRVADVRPRAGRRTGWDSMATIVADALRLASSRPL
jgi:hypothetical protein